MCVINDKVHYAAEITKTNTVHLETMRSPNRGPAGFIDAEIVTFFSPTIRRHTTQSQFSSPTGTTELPHVEVI